MSTKELIDQFDDFLKSSVSKKRPSFEEVFEKTLEVTTPTEPGDLRQHRKPEVERAEMDEWI